MSAVKGIDAKLHVLDIIHLKAFSAFVIALSLTYLNLPNLRFSERLRQSIHRLLHQKTSYGPPTILSGHDDYKVIWVIGSLSTFATSLPVAFTPPKNMNQFQLDADETQNRNLLIPGSSIVQFFIIFFCRNSLDRKVMSYDKIIAALVFVFAAFYLFYITQIEIHFDARFTKWALFFGIFIPVSYYLWQCIKIRDFVVAALILVPTSYCFLYIYFNPIRDSLPIPLGDQNVAMAVLLSGAIIVTIMVVLSHIWYPRAEKALLHVTDQIVAVPSPWKQNTPTLEKEPSLP